METNKLILFFVLIGLVACKKPVTSEPDHITITKFPIKERVDISTIKTDSVILAPEKIYQLIMKVNLACIPSFLVTRNLKENKDAKSIISILFPIHIEIK